MARVFRKGTLQIRCIPIRLLLRFGISVALCACDAEPDVAASLVDTASGGGGPTDPPSVGMGGAFEVPSPFRLSGDLGAHDPEVVVTDLGYHLFSTGNLVMTKASSDLLDWRATGEVFSEMPAWIPDLLSGVNDLWAPDVSFFGGRFHLYYAASTFGTGISCIGHATSTTLGDAAEWQDQGSVICSDIDEVVDWDAIDPNTFVDELGNSWMVFGSYSSGIKLIALGADGTRSDSALHSLATRPEEAIQAPALFFHEGYYYLFASFDQCCAGVRSTSTIRVGRSTQVTGPFVDKEGTPLLDGGGTPFISGDQTFPAVGGSSFFSASGQWYVAYHAYDASSAGQATLRIGPVIFDEQLWPLEQSP